MNSKLSFLSLLLLLLFSAQFSYANDEAEPSPAIEECAHADPEGLKTLMDQYREEIQRHIANPSTPSDARWQRITTALDAVAQQRNSYISGLYWHTNLEEAKKAAAAENKPILSLRLLGKLTDEFSCANSRFFRTVLYSNADVSKYLREHYVLHWQSVRPVPKVTIDYGDGRKLERTLTGNSIHYILDSRARLLDAIPGLYGPQAFQRVLVNSETLFKSLVAKNDVERNLLLAKYHTDQLNKITLDWAVDTTKIGGKMPEGLRIEKTENGDALTVAPLAVTKAITERPILQAMTQAKNALGSVTDEAAWAKIAALHSSDAILDSLSIGLIKRQNPTLTEQEMKRLLRRFQELIALDTVRNEYMMHAEIYTWLMRDPARMDVEKFNEKVYAILFRTPQADPWLGLVSADVYTALDNGGIVKP